MNETTTVNINDTPVFTRYLYIKSDVYISLLLSILEKDTEQSLYWAYELYHSGFHYELTSFIEIVFREFYSLNKKLKNFIEKKINEFRVFKTREWVLAIILANITTRNNKFSSEKNKSKKIIYIIYDINDVIQYRTLSISSEVRNWKLLSKVCVYPTTKKCYIENIPTLLSNFMKLPYSRNELKDIFRNHWMYYSYFTPIWKERLESYHVIVDHENKKIYFQSDDLMDSFDDKWNYEPDEQPAWILEFCIGIEEEQNITLLVDEMENLIV